MFDIQEREEQDFNRMGPAEEMRWQHAQGMTCSFDCAACDPADLFGPEESMTPEEIAAWQASRPITHAFTAPDVANSWF